MFNRKKKAQDVLVVHKDLMEKKQQCTHLTTTEIKRNGKIWRAKLLYTAYCTRKRTNVPSSLFSPSLACQRTQSSPNDNTAKVLTKHKTKKINATSGLGLTSNRTWILETTLNVKKATRRRRRLPPRGSEISFTVQMVYQKRYCSFHSIKLHSNL